MRKLICVVSSLCLMAFASVSMAAGPGTGTATKHNLRIGQCYADSVTVKWDLDSLMGEPTVSGSY